MPVTVTEVDTPAARRRKLFVWADTLGLTRDERIEFSRYLLRRDIISWRTLDDDQVLRLLDAMEGAHLYLELVRQR